MTVKLNSRGLGPSGHLWENRPYRDPRIIALATDGACSWFRGPGGYMVAPGEPVVAHEVRRRSRGMRRGLRNYLRKGLIVLLEDKAPDASPKPKPAQARSRSAVSGPFLVTR